MPNSTKAVHDLQDNPYSDDMLPQSNYFTSTKRTKFGDSMAGDITKGKTDVSKSAKFEDRDTKGMGKPALSDLFNRTHMSGFGGIKSKYTQKLGQRLDEKLAEKNLVAEEELSHTVRLFRKENLTKPHSRNQGVRSTNNSRGGLKSSIMTKREVPRNFNSDAEQSTFEQDTSQSTFASLKQTRRVTNFMTNKIDLRQTLRKYKRELNAKYPDPEKKTAEEPISPEKGKKAPPKDDKSKPVSGKDKGKQPETAKASTHDEDENAPYGDLSELDSVIDDEIDDNLEPNEDNAVNPLSFTQNPKYMYGAPIAPEIMEHIDELPSSRQHEQDAKLIKSMNATKTAFHQKQIFKDFNYKQENLMEILQQQAKKPEFRVRTKGKFADSVA